MSASVMCINCQVGECDHCLVGHTQEGLLGGWSCPCDHDPDEANVRLKKAREDVARKFSISADQQELDTSDCVNCPEYLAASLDYQERLEDEIKRLRKRLKDIDDRDAVQNADCVRCADEASENVNGLTSRRMILCPNCGDKRCPKALDHNNECTGLTHIKD